MRGRGSFVAGIVALGAAGAVGACNWFGGGAPSRPNVLIVLWDTVRADHLSLYGYDKPTSPRLEAFARDATVYERATAPGMWTLNSHAAMFTGLYETSHGAKPSHRWLDDHYTTLAESLLAAGYDTFMFSSNLIAAPLTNLDQGFATVHTSFDRKGAPKGRYNADARRATAAKLLPGDASTEISPAFSGQRKELWDKAVFKDAAPVAHQALIDWLGEREGQDKPFLAYLNLMEAHTPRVPSLKARQQVADQATIDQALALDNSLFAANEYILGKRELGPDQQKALTATYDAALVDLDDATGDLLDDLKARGILDDTVVIVVADHGEHLGEHRRLEHRWSVYDPLLHVPLVIRYPEKFSAKRVPERVSTIDLYATILGLAGAPGSAEARSTSLAGRTTYDPFVFSQMLDPYASQMANVREAYADLQEPKAVAEWAKTYCVAYQGDQKLIYASDGRHERYDLAADAGEAQNTYAAGAESLEKALYDFEAALPVYDPAQMTKRDHPEGGNREERAMLESLGYADPDEADVLRDYCGPYGRKP